MEKVFIVIPAYNEEKNIGIVLRKTKKLYKNIIVVDDGSSDDTFKEAKKEKVITLKHIVNMGKGLALKTGIEKALSLGADTIVTMDADQQHNPNKIFNLVRQKEFDIVIGARDLDFEMPIILRLGNFMLCKAFEVLFGLQVKDTQSGFRAYKAHVFDKIRWESTGYSVESEILAEAGKNNYKVKEVPIDTIYMDKYKGTTVFDGIKIFLDMFYWKVRK